MIKKYALISIICLFCCSAVYGQAFGSIDMKLGGNTLSSNLYDENHTSFSWGIGFNVGTKIGKYGVFSGGLHFSTNTAWGSSIGGGYETDGQYSNSFVDAFFDIGTMQMPIKLGILAIGDKDAIGFFANAGFAPEVLLSRRFNYYDYTVNIKNSFGFSLLADGGIAIRLSSTEFITISGYYSRVLTRYRDAEYPDETFKRYHYGVNIGLLGYF